jgi:hypothetical protein
VSFKVVAKVKRKRSFSVETFLSTVDGGRTVSNYRKNQKVFSQGDPADSVFYMQAGKVKVSVISEPEPVIAKISQGTPPPVPHTPTLSPVVSRGVNRRALA